MKNKKRGEISTQMIVFWILLIASFVILLFFLFRANLGGESRIEICRNSVMLRGTSQLATEIPLKCTRDYVCITNDGNCKGMVKPRKVKVKTENEVYEALAQEMSDCWFMFGEGRVNYVSNTNIKRNYCSICSQILFDPSLAKVPGIGKEISKDKLYKYMSMHNVSGKGITYSEYILGTKDIDSLKEAIANGENNSIGVSSFGSIELGKQYYVIMGITSDISTTGWAIRGAAAGAAIIGIGIPLATGVVVGGTLAIAVGATGGGIVGSELSDAEIISRLMNPRIGALVIPGKGVDNRFMVPTIEEVDPENIQALNCEEIITSSSGGN